MIGETIGTVDLSTSTGSLPDHTSEITTFRKRNQDNYGAEYFLRGTAHDYLIKVRNSLESPNLVKGYQFSRHNFEFSLFTRATGSVREIPYIVSLTARFDKDLGDAAVLKALAGHATRIWASNTVNSVVGGFLQQQLNFES